MPAQKTGRQNAILLVVLLALQLLLMSRSGSSRASLLIESWLMRLSSPAVVLAHWVAGSLNTTITDAEELFAARERNASLRADVRRLSAELVHCREAQPENRRLRSLLGMRDDVFPDAIAASVVTSNLTGLTRMIVIDRGLADGVRKDLPVVAWGGAVGRVVQANRGHSKVRLLTDASSGVAGVVQRSRAQGMVLGGAKSTLDLLYVPRFSDVLHGDRVVTSGLDGIFPRGFAIGRINAIVADIDGAQTIHLEPALDYRLIEEVLVLVDPYSADRDQWPEPENAP